ncbi:hypothetical protein [Actinomycetospora sp. NBRC 106378]|jgi:hypothetical protein|nr:hypothetical protein [Actinomycetospora sp. NBRC 106378]GLZ55411.1 hypothetical protein Acsp07_50280 [Actinomycetospora sp. NBRC 106378]
MSPTGCSETHHATTVVDRPVRDRARDEFPADDAHDEPHLVRGLD